MYDRDTPGSTFALAAAVRLLQVRPSVFIGNGDRVEERHIHDGSLVCEICVIAPKGSSICGLHVSTSAQGEEFLILHLDNECVVMGFCGV